MPRPRALLTYAAGIALCAAGAAVIFSLVFSAREGTAAAPELWPDLVQRVPTALSVSRNDGRFALGFESAVENHGVGRLVVVGRRSAAERDMTADQWVQRADGSNSRVEDIGVLRYTRSPSHQHWHYLRFDRYELRRASDHRLARPDHKTGFCLGDRYDPGRDMPRKPQRPVLTGECLKNRPEARRVVEGISVGYGDDYPAYLEGQSIDITRLPPGDYQLVHRVNADRRLRESSHANNASSVLLRVAWPRGMERRPAVKQLKTCPRRERCVS